jgi:cytochrome c-type biogenesis protein
VITNFSNTVIDGSLFLAIPIALLVGLISFLSPCVLPLVPGYLSFAAGLSAVSATSKRARLRVFLGSLFFVLGFTLVFVSYGSLFGGLGLLLAKHQSALTRVLGVVTILMGLLFAGVFKQTRQWRPKMRTDGGLWGAPLLGILFGLGWTPCLGPILSTILGLATTQASALRGAILAGFFSLGIGIPFILVGLLFQSAMLRLAFFRKHARIISLIGGLILILIGVLEVTGLWDTFTIFLRNSFSGFNPVL